MRENVTLNENSPWTLESVQTLQRLWTAAVPAPLIAHTLGRPEAAVRAKALELKLARQAKPG